MAIKNLNNKEIYISDFFDYTVQKQKTSTRYDDKEKIYIFYAEHNAANRRKNPQIYIKVPNQLIGFSHYALNFYKDGKLYLYPSESKSDGYSVTGTENSALKRIAVSANVAPQLCSWVSEEGYDPTEITINGTKMIMISKAKEDKK